MTRHQNRGPTIKLAPVLSAIVFIAALSPSTAKISDKRLCFDNECSVVVSKGITLLPYNSKDHDVLSFPVNAEVKIFSKSAGSRKDLWGVEIKGRRGYAPLRFIRELQILESNLKFEVPTEEFYKKNHQNNNEEVEANNNDTSGNVQETSSDSSNEDLKDTIIPSHVTQPYENVYDGTILPQEIEEVESSSFNYSSETEQDNVKLEEEVRLNVFPTILSSIFAGASDILNDVEENVEENNVESSSADEVVNEETVNKTGEIEKTDEHNLNSEVSTDNVSNNEEFENKEEEVLEVEKNDVVNDIISQITNEEKESENFEGNGNKQINNINSEDEALKIGVDEIDLINNLMSQNTVQESSTLEYVSLDKSSDIGITEEEKSALGTFEENVPKLEEVIAVDDLSNNYQNETDVISSTDKTILDHQNNISPITDKHFSNVEDANSNLGDTLKSFDNENSVAPEVPLTEKNEEKSAIEPNESFLPYSSTFQPYTSEDKIQPTENSSKDFDNLNESDVFIDASNIPESSNNFEQTDNETLVEGNNNYNNNYDSNLPAYLHNESVIESTESSFQSTDSGHEHTVKIPSTSSFGEFLGNRNLLNADKDSEEIGVDNVVLNDNVQTTISYGNENLSHETKDEEENISLEEVPAVNSIEKMALPSETCDKIFGCSSDYTKHQYSADENAVTNVREPSDNSERLLYVCITAVTTLLFSLGYYFIESKRRDAFLIGKINKLEKELMITRKECNMLDDNFKSTKTKLDSIEDESFGSNEMVLSLKTELASSENARLELEDQISLLEKELESTSEAGLELERMLREILSSHNEENNPLAKSIEELQTRLNDQQIANESLTNAIGIKTQENETLTNDLTVSLKKLEKLQSDLSKIEDDFKTETSTRIQLEQTLSGQVQTLELQLKTITEEKSYIHQQLRMKELELKELLKVVDEINANNLNLESLYEVSHIKAEAAHLVEERDELKIRLSEEEGAHQLLEEHVKLVKEEVSLLSEQCKAAEKEKKEAETRLEVLTKFFEEKEAQRQKEELVWLEKQGEVRSTVERIQSMQNEIMNYKQQIEMLKREIVDQEREYKNQISVIETKAHEHWVTARQNERRLEEAKVESSQLRNRLTLVEKNMNDGDSEVKLHRLQAVAANGEIGPSPPHPLYAGMGAAAPGGSAGGETSSSPLMFVPGAGGGGGIVGPPPPLPPSAGYLYPPFPPPPFLPPPPTRPGAGGDLVGSRPPPLGGGRLSSPPPLGGAGNHHGGGAGSPPPPLSPPPSLMHYPPSMMPPPPPLHHQLHHLHGLPPPPPRSGPQMHHQQQQRSHHNHHQEGIAQHGGGGPGWGDEPPMRNSFAGPYSHQQQQQQQRADHQRISRNHKGSLHSSGESLDKSHHGKV